MALSMSDLRNEAWPAFTEAQVSFLEELFPARCIGHTESIEDHIRYAGKVDLIAQLRAHTVGGAARLQFTEDEEEAFDDQAVSILREKEG